MAMTLVSRILGLLRIRVISSLFGASVHGDLLFFTLNIPNNFRKLLAEGALSSAFVPEYSSRLARDQGEARLFFIRVLLVLLAISAGLFFVFFLFGEQILLALSDFDAEVISGTGTLLLIIFSLYTAGILLITVTSGALHVHKRFFLPSLAPMILSVSVIIFSLTWFRSHGVQAAAWGFAAGALIPLFLLLPMLNRLTDRRYSAGSSSGFYRRWGLLAALSSAFFIDQQVSFYLASTLQEGSVVQFSNAIVIWQMPYGVVSASILTAWYPRMSSAYSNGSEQELLQTMEQGLLYMMLFLLPASVMLFVFAPEITSLILLSGSYTKESVEATAELIRWFAPGILMLGITQLYMRELYVRKHWRRAGARAALFAGTDILLSILLIRTPLGLSGLGAAFTISYMLTAAVSLVHSSISTAAVLRCLRIAAVNLGVGALTFALTALVPSWGPSWISQALYVMLFAAAGLLGTALVYRRIGYDVIQLLTGR